MVRKTKTGEQKTLRTSKQRKASSCAVVGMGASAGGLEAFRKFFDNMPADSGMAFVLIPHLDPRHESMLAELLARHTAMPVEQVKEQVSVEPNRVYVMPPNAALTIKRGVLILESPSPERVPRTPIDRFFRSLAEDQAEHAICIVLSGTGSDGTLGLRAVKEHGGLAIAEAPGSARYDGMPRSAIATGFVDHVLPVEEMPARLIDHVRHLDRLEQRKGPDGILEDAADSLARICNLLKHQTGHDFSHYKGSTLIRRIQRRMHVVQAGSTNDYVEQLRQDPKEVDLLFRDLLIGVTHFFRDPEAFEVLAERVIPRLFADEAADSVRVWVSACATGEEAYSIAILLSEQLAQHPSPARVQIFATDIDDQALEIARQARYPEGIAEQVAPGRLERYFTKDGHRYRIARPIRDLVIFSNHSPLKDPPFSRIDLLCCRNFLIYLEAGLQKKLLNLYHYALQPAGYLFLGSSENAVGPPELFRTIDKKHRIFQRKALIAGPPIVFPLVDPAREVRPLSEMRQQPVEVRATDIAAISERILLDRFAPASVIINERGEIVYYCGRTGKYLEPSAGAPTSNIVSMARKGLRMELRTAIHKAIKVNDQIIHQNVRVQANGGTQRINLIVRPLPELGDDSQLFMVIFQDIGGDQEEGRPQTARTPGEEGLVQQLDDELRSTKDHLQSTIEELETANEELKSSNEELLSMNEELQSGNEELQTSKEELQSVNEELETVNVELHTKVDELDQVNSDLQNLFCATPIPTVFVDNELRIKKFTPAATRIFPLIDTDIGRPIADITSRLDDEGLEPEIQAVLDTLATRERRVRLAGGDGSYIMCISPYRTLDHMIQGVVITFVDVTELERSREQAAQLAAIVNFSSDAIFAKTLDHTITCWNGGAERIYGWSAAEAIGRKVTMLLPPELQAEPDEIQDRLRRGEVVMGMETVHLRKDGIRIDASLTFSPIRDPDGEFGLISVVARDITERKRQERELRRANEALTRSNEDLQQLAFGAAHDLQEPLRMVSNYAQLLVTSCGEALDEQGQAFLGNVVSGAQRLDGLLHALHRYWSADQADHHFAPLDSGHVLESAIRNLSQGIEESAAEISYDRLPTVVFDETPLLETFQNLLGNAIKYRREGVPLRIHVSARPVSGQWEFSVVDNGVGVPAQHRERIFVPFKRLHGSNISGEGMGLAICSRIFKRCGGRIWVEPSGEGSTFKFTLPFDVPS